MEYIATRARTELTTTIDDSETLITIDDTTRFPELSPFIILIDDELFRVTEVDGSDLTVERGFEDTTPVAHTSGATVTMVVTAKTLDNLNFYQGPSNDAYTARKFTVSTDNMIYVQDSQSDGNLSIALNLRSKLGRILVDQEVNIVGQDDGDITGVSITYDPQNFTPILLITYDVHVDDDYNWVKVMEGVNEIFQHVSPGTGHRQAMGHLYYQPGTGSKTYKLTIDVPSALTVTKATLSLFVLSTDHMSSDELSTGDGGGEGRGDIPITGGGGG